MVVASEVVVEVVVDVVIVVVLGGPQLRSGNCENRGHDLSIKMSDH